VKTDKDPSRIAIEWIEKWSHIKATTTANSTASGLDDRIPRNDPELCLATILEVLKRIPCDPSDQHFQVLAAGPLEDLLVYSGNVCVDQVELAARQIPAFRLLLNGVWSPSIKPDVLAQLAKYRTTPW
jgi:uncharacterized protein DUF6869